MQQKTIYKLFLIFGISILYSFLFISCGRTTIDYLVIGEFYYINKTGGDVDIYRLPSERATTVEHYLIKNNDSLYYSYTTEGSKNMSPNDFAPGLQADSLTIVFFDTLCITYSNREGYFFDLNNYENQKVKDNHYIFRFTFTPEIVAMAQPCD